MIFALGKFREGTFFTRVFQMNLSLLQAIHTSVSTLLSQPCVLMERTLDLESEDLDSRCASASNWL